MNFIPQNSGNAAKYRMSVFEGKQDFGGGPRSDFGVGPQSVLSPDQSRAGCQSPAAGGGLWHHQVWNRRVLGVMATVWNSTAAVGVVQRDELKRASSGAKPQCVSRFSRLDSLSDLTSLLDISIRNVGTIQARGG